MVTRGGGGGGGAQEGLGLHKKQSIDEDKDVTYADGHSIQTQSQT